MLSRLTTRVDLRLVSPFPASDQGIRPICAAMAVTGAHEIVRTNDYGPPPIQLAPDALWTHAWNRQLAGPDGTYLFAIGDALEGQGQPELANWPLDGHTMEASATPIGAGSPPWMRATLTEHTWDRVRLFTELSEGRPVVLLVHVTDEFHYADPTTGRIKSPDPSAARQGLHAILCMGYAEDEDAKAHFLIRNSWGEAWGAQGYAWLPDDYTDNFCLHMGSISDPLSFP
jgi:hypothetical protein